MGKARGPRGSAAWGQKRAAVRAVEEAIQAVSRMGVTAHFAHPDSLASNRACTAMREFVIEMTGEPRWFEPVPHAAGRGPDDRFSLAGVAQERRERFFGPAEGKGAAENN